jgi:hypothetical protein
MTRETTRSGRLNRTSSTWFVIVAAVLAGPSCKDPPLCFGLHVGDRVAITLVDTYEVPGTGNFAGEYDATNSTCSGHVQVNLTVAPGAGPFAASVPGQPPNVYLSRSFSGCQKACSGSFLVNLKRL